MKDEAGFTLMETLCVIALLIICAGVAGNILTNTRRITDNIQNRSDSYYVQLRVETIIRETVEDIVLPYWEKDEMAITLAVEAVTAALAKNGFDIVIEINGLYDALGRARGVTCRYKIDEIAYENSSLFASVPLERGIN